MKEIGKLLELLNEYEFKVADTYNYAEREATEEDLERLSERIISKKFGFIKWLVENDKIDTEKEIKNSELNWLHEHYFREDCLLMLLAVQDNPIDFLISILK